mmetsp:Transcript_17716/g.41188  ORF Transcript_17716/g.41188 Transcript_17716/m.41188 type:complete len:221 (-) Transcript_17716:884-1546(-)
MNLLVAAPQTSSSVPNLGVTLAPAEMQLLLDPVPGQVLPATAEKPSLAPVLPSPLEAGSSRDLGRAAEGAMPASLACDSSALLGAPSPPPQKPGVVHQPPQSLPWQPLPSNKQMPAQPARLLAAPSVRQADASFPRHAVLALLHQFAKPPDRSSRLLPHPPPLHSDLWHPVPATAPPPRLLSPPPAVPEGPQEVSAGPPLPAVWPQLLAAKTPPWTSPLR